MCASSETQDPFCSECDDALYFPYLIGFDRERRTAGSKRYRLAPGNRIQYGSYRLDRAGHCVVCPSGKKYIGSPAQYSGTYFKAGAGGDHWFLEPDLLYGDISDSALLAGIFPGSCVLFCAFPEGSFFSESKGWQKKRAAVFLGDLAVIVSADTAFKTW